MRRYWGRFAANGDPNGGDDLTWPMFSGDKDDRLNFDVELSTLENFRSDVCALWESVYASDFE